MQATSVENMFSSCCKLALASTANWGWQHKHFYFTLLTYVYLTNSYVKVANIFLKIFFLSLTKIYFLLLRVCNYAYSCRIFKGTRLLRWRMTFSQSYAIQNEKSPPHITPPYLNVGGGSEEIISCFVFFSLSS